MAMSEGTTWTLGLVRDKTATGGDSDKDRAACDERRLRERGQALRLAVPVRVPFVGGL